MHLFDFLPVCSNYISCVLWKIWQEQGPWWEPLMPPLLTPPQWCRCSPPHQDSSMIQCCQCLCRVPSEWCLSCSLTSPGLPVQLRSEELVCESYSQNKRIFGGFLYISNQAMNLKLSLSWKKENLTSGPVDWFPFLVRSKQDLITLKEQKIASVDTNCLFPIFR